MTSYRSDKDAWILTGSFHHQKHSFEATHIDSPLALSLVTCKIYGNAVVWRETFANKLATGVHPNCTSPHVYERYLVRIDFILDLLEIFKQCSVPGKKRNTHYCRIPLKLSQTILVRLMNVIPLSSFELDILILLIGWTTQSLYIFLLREQAHHIYQLGKRILLILYLKI